MQKVSFEKGSLYFNMFGDYYTITKCLINGDAAGERPDSYWEDAIQAVDCFYKKYSASSESREYAKNLSLALVTELERRGKEEQAEKTKLLAALG